MIILNNKPIVFLHNPKTGGRYIRKKLKDSCERHGNIRILRYRGIRMYLGHLNAKDARKFLAKYPGYSIISMVRNPYNRICSIFNEQIWMNAEMAQLYRDKGEDIKEFWKTIQAMPPAEQNRLLRDPNVPWYNPQSWWMADDITSYQYESVDDWNRLSNDLGIDTSDLNIKTDYPVDAELLEILKQLYPEDINLFNAYGL